jgi:histone-lysine N-methyltransferase SETMAR
MHAHSFLGLQRHHSPGVNGQRYVNQFQDLCEDPKEAETMNKSCSLGIIMLFRHDNARPPTSAATTAAVESIGFDVVPRPPYSPDLAPSDFWLFGALEKHLKGNCFTCAEEVQAASTGGVVSNEWGTTWKHEV